MSDRNVTQTRFTDEEVREILRRAVRIESTALAERHDGISLDDLRSIGEEVGIDGPELERAARSVLAERSQRSARLLGGPRSLHVEASVAGTPSPDSFPDLVATIRQTVGRRGSATDLQGSLEWTHESESIDEYVTLATADGRTTVRAGADLSNLAAITFVPTGIVGSIFSLIALTQAAEADSAVGMVLCLLAIPALFLVLRLVYGKLASAEEAKLELVVDELARAVRENDES